MIKVLSILMLVIFVALPQVASAQRTRLIERFVELLARDSKLSRIEIQKSFMKRLKNSQSTFSKYEGIAELSKLNVMAQMSVVEFMRTDSVFIRSLRMRENYYTTHNNPHMEFFGHQPRVSETSLNRFRAELIGGKKGRSFLKFTEEFSEHAGASSISKKLIESEFRIRAASDMELLGRGCNLLSNSESLKNLRNIIEDFERSVVRAKVRMSKKNLEKLFRNTFREKLNLSKREARLRICKLISACHVFSPKSAGYCK